jgi:CopG family nickel-responsive transcriptional regulator
MDLQRFGVSMPEDLLKEFDRYIAQRNYQNRSEAIRDLIRDKLVEQEWVAIEEGKDVVGVTNTVTRF